MAKTPGSREKTHVKTPPVRTAVGKRRVGPSEMPTSLDTADRVDLGAASALARRPKAGSTPDASVSFIVAPGGVRSIPYAALGRLSSVESSTLVRRGIEAESVKLMARDLGLDQSLLADALHIARSTLGRKLARRGLLSVEDSAKVLGVARLVGEVDRILAESGDPALMKDFSVVQWVGEWMQAPVGALGFRRPLDYLDNVYSQQIVFQLLGQMQAGTFA